MVGEFIAIIEDLIVAPYDILLHYGLKYRVSGWGRGAQWAIIGVDGELEL